MVSGNLGSSWQEMHDCGDGSTHSGDRMKQLYSYCDQEDSELYENRARLYLQNAHPCGINSTSHTPQPPKPELPTGGPHVQTHQSALEGISDFSYDSE